MRPVAPIRMWAVVIVNPRTQWIHGHTIRRTRKEAAEAYMQNWLPEFAERQWRRRNKTWRTVPVIVSSNEEDTFR